MTSWVCRVWESSIGQKWLMALSGLFMILFLLGHLSGNLLIYAGPEAINTYAETLRKFPAALWGFRIVTLLAIVMHVWTAIKLTRRNRAAMPVSYNSNQWKGSTWSSRNMGLTGLVILLYVIYHLAHFTWRNAHPEMFAGVGEFDAYQMIVISFSQTWLAVLYVLAMFILSLHLSHSVSSAVQTLGINHPKYNLAIRRIGDIVAIGLFFGFSSIPVGVMLGLIK